MRRDELVACIRRWGGLAALACLLAAPAISQTAPSVTGFTVTAPAISPQLHIKLNWTAPTDSNFTGYAVTYQSTGSLIDAAYNLSGMGSGDTGGSLYSTPGRISNCATAGTGTARTNAAAGTADHMIIVGMKPNISYTVTLRACNGTSAGTSVSGTITTAKYEGYGYQAVGGGEQPFCAVTSLSEGNGTCPSASSCTLRTCLANNRYVVFSVGGTISMDSAMDARKNNLTVDGSTAPSPGITIGTSSNTSANLGLCLNAGFMFGSIPGGTASHQILTYVRFKGNMPSVWCTSSQKSLPAGCNTSGVVGCTSSEDLFGVYGSSGGLVNHIVIDHCTFRDVVDSALDISTSSAQDISVSYNLVMRNVHPVLMSVSGTDARISFHHNAFLDNKERVPFYLQVTQTDFDFVNNVVWHYCYDPQGSNRGYSGGFACNNGESYVAVASTANIVNNYYLAFPPTNGSGNNEIRGLQYGTKGGYDSTEGGASYPDCKKQGTVYTGSSVGEVWLSGNAFPIGNCDEYSTVPQARAVPTAAAITTDSADNLEVTVLPTVGTWYRTGEELALFDQVVRDMRPELLTDGGFETGVLAAQFTTVPAVCDCPTPVAGIDTTAPPGPQAGTYYASATYATCANPAISCQALKLTLTGLTIGRLYTFSGYWATPYVGTTLRLYQNGATSSNLSCFFTDVAIAGTNPIRNSVGNGCVIHSDTLAVANTWSQFSAVFTAEATSHVFYFYGDAVAGPANLGVQVDSLSIR